MSLDFDALTEQPPDHLVPALDRADHGLGELTPAQQTWRDNGYLILRGFLPDTLIAPYVEAHQRDYATERWPSLTTYMSIPECKNLCLYRPLTSLLAELIGDTMALHLNLSGWRSTERNWHQDDYLNPDYINSWYAAVWFALDDIHPDSGPFQYVPGSHRWPVLRRDKILEQLTPTERTDPAWPKYSERFLTQMVETKLEAIGVQPETFHARKGDVLIWHGRLLHRGSPPNTPGMERRALIAHYSAVSKRADMPVRQYHEEPELNVAGWYFSLNPH